MSVRELLCRARAASARAAATRSSARAATRTAAALVATRTAAALVAATLLPGCVIWSGNAVPAASDLDEARARWSHVAWSDYDMVVMRSCFCIGAGRYDVRVRGDSVALVTPADEYAHPVDASWWGELFPTVDGLFDLAERALREADEVGVEFDEQGWPTRLDIDWIADAVDDELFYSIESVSPVDGHDLIELPAGATGEVMGLFVRFDGVAADSRCARDVVCVWAGDVSVNLVVTDPGLNRTEATLTTPPAREGASDSVVVGDVRLRLVAVLPYPERAGTPIPAESYRVRLLAEHA